jgi:glycosyltransferase Alg8
LTLSVLSCIALLLIASLLYGMIPARELATLDRTLVGVGALGLVRYSWLALNHLRAGLWICWAFPRLRREERTLPVEARYPRRLYVVVPSYKEDPRITRRAVAALMRELQGIQSSVFLQFNVGSAEEVDLIQSQVRCQVSSSTPSLKISFMVQRHGKRIALGQSLRAVARDFHGVTDWHRDACNDVVVLMDGDTELLPGALRHTLGFFRVDPKLGALTTDETADFLAPEPVMQTWFDMKFARRHVMMSSHSLSRRVLTLTGRFSVFRAAAILDEHFIRGIENDHLDHWACGRFRFLMGDDKSTWYQLLQRRWRMIYVPDCCIRSIEGRVGGFLKVTPG